MRILATDFDGTLFRNQKITRRDLAAIARFRAAGHKFGIVTGRHLCSIQKELQRWALTPDFVICCTGGILTDGNFLILSEHCAEQAALQPLFEKTLQFGGEYFCVSRYFKRFWFDVGVVPPYADVTVLPPAQLHTVNGFHEMGTRFADETQAQAFTDALNAAYAHLLTAHRNGIYVDVCAAHTGKTSGLYELLARYGAEKEQLFVAGDNLNDLEMIREFQAFAMRKGRRELQAVAAHTVGSIAKIIQIIS